MVPVISPSKVFVHISVHVLSTYSLNIIQKNYSINTVLSLNFRLNSLSIIKSAIGVNFQSHSVFNNHDCLINK